MSIQKALTVANQYKAQLQEALKVNEQFLAPLDDKKKKEFVDNFLELSTQKYLLDNVDTTMLIKLAIDLTKIGLDINPFKKEVYIIPFETKIAGINVKVPTPIIPLPGWKKYFAKMGFLLDVQKVWKLDDNTAKLEKDMSYIELAQIDETDPKYRDEHFLGWEFTLIDLKKELPDQKVFVSRKYAKAAEKNSQTPKEFKLEGEVHKAIRKANKNFVIPPERMTLEFEELLKVENEAYSDQNTITAEIVEQKQDIKKEFANYLLNNSIPKQALKSFTDFSKNAGFDLADDGVKKALLEDKETLNRLIESFIDESMTESAQPQQAALIPETEEPPI